MGWKHELDIIPSTFVSAIDEVASEAPGVSQWWVDLVGAAEALKKAYTSGDLSNFPESYDQVRPYTYLPYFAPRYIPRLRHALKAAGLVLENLLRLQQNRIRVLDIGAGTGLTTAACLFELESACAVLGTKAWVDVVLYDQHWNSLEVALNLIDRARIKMAWPHLEINCISRIGDLWTTLPEGSYDLILMGHVVCEAYQWKTTTRLDLDNRLRPLLSQIGSLLSMVGVLIILEPINSKHLVKILWVRDVAAAGILGVCAPCLGGGQYCPEETQNAHPAACSGSTHTVTWDHSTMAGYRLRLFTEAALATKGISALPATLQPSAFFPLLLSRAKRLPAPAGVGMFVRRLGVKDARPVCLVDHLGNERVELIPHPGWRADRTVFEPVDLRSGSPTDFDMSALYPNGWPRCT